MSKQNGRGGMGSKKHGVSGHSGPSPRTKLMTALDANRRQDEENARRRKPVMHASVADAISRERR